MMDIHELLQREGISEQTALRDQAIIVGLAKVSHFEATCRKFEHKYGADFETVKSAVDREKGIEDFQKEDDLLDWEYASTSLAWWRNAVREVRSAA